MSERVSHPSISAIALANMIKDHRAKNEWNSAIEFYLRGHDALSRELAAARASLDEALGLLRELHLSKDGEWIYAEDTEQEWIKRRDALLRKVGM